MSTLKSLYFPTVRKYLQVWIYTYVNSLNVFVPHIPLIKKKTRTPTINRVMTGDQKRLDDYSLIKSLIRYTSHTSFENSRGSY